MNADLTIGRGSKTSWCVWVLAPLVVVLLLLLIPAVLIWCLLLFVVKLSVLLVIWALWLPRGKDTLIVYSRSPHWEKYFETELMPRLEHRATTLNWSDRAKWSVLDLRVLAFHAFAGEKSFNPLVMLFRPFRWPKRFRFLDSFKDLKRGKEQSLQELEAKLEKALGAELKMPLIC